VIKGIGDVLFGGAALIELSQDALSGAEGVVVPLGGPYLTGLVRSGRGRDKTTPANNIIVTPGDWVGPTRLPAQGRKLRTTAASGSLFGL